MSSKTAIWTHSAPANSKSWIYCLCDNEKVHTHANFSTSWPQYTIFVCLYLSSLFLALPAGIVFSWDKSASLTAVTPAPIIIACQKFRQHVRQTCWHVQFGLCLEVCRERGQGFSFDLGTSHFCCLTTPPIDQRKRSVCGLWSLNENTVSLSTKYHESLTVLLSNKMQFQALKIYSMGS